MRRLHWVVGAKRTENALATTTRDDSWYGEEKMYHYMMRVERTETLMNLKVPYVVSVFSELTAGIDFDECLSVPF